MRRKEWREEEGRAVIPRHQHMSEEQKTRLRLCRLQQCWGSVTMRAPRRVMFLQGLAG